MIYNNSGKSIPQKILVQVLQSILLGIGIYLLLSSQKFSQGNSIRHWMLIVTFAISYLRLTFTILYLLKRSMGWEEAISVPIAFAVYYIGFSLLGRNNQEMVGLIEYAGILLFVIGSVINTLSELLRNRWKKDEKNSGKLYTGGLFKYAMHINYFGDILWVLGLALLTGNPWSLIIPFLLFCFFAFYNGPLLDKYLKEKYGRDFIDYAARTKKIVPFIF